MNESRVRDAKTGLARLVDCLTERAWTMDGVGPGIGEGSGVTKVGIDRNMLPRNLAGENSQPLFHAQELQMATIEEI